MRVLILAALAVAVLANASPAAATCILAQCKNDAASSTPSRSYITNDHRQRLGDVYNPGNGRRVQIRDTSRRILGYIAPDGSITNPSRQKVGTLGAFGRKGSGTVEGAN